MVQSWYNLGHLTGAELTEEANIWLCFWNISQTGLTEERSLENIHSGPEQQIPMEWKLRLNNKGEQK